MSSNITRPRVRVLNFIPISAIWRKVWRSQKWPCKCTSEPSVTSPGAWISGVITSELWRENTSLQSWSGRYLSRPYQPASPPRALISSSGSAFFITRGGKQSGRRRRWPSPWVSWGPSLREPTLHNSCPEGLRGKNLPAILSFKLLLLSRCLCHSWACCILKMKWRAEEWSQERNPSIKLLIANILAEIIYQLLFYHNIFIWQ